MLKLAKLGKRCQMVLPKEIRDVLGVQEGNLIAFWVHGRQVQVAGAKDFALQTQGILRGTWGSTRKEIDDHILAQRASWE